MRILYDNAPESGDQMPAAASDPLRDLGWDGYFEAKIAELDRKPGRATALEPARVLEVRRGSFIVAARGEQGRPVELEAKPLSRLPGE